MIDAAKTPSQIDVEELQFAQHILDRLIKRLRGLLAIGLPSLVTGVPESLGFFEECFQVLTALATVLHTIAGQPGATETIVQLRQCSAAVRKSLLALHRALAAVRLDSIGQSDDPFLHSKEATKEVCN